MQAHSKCAGRFAVLEIACDPVQVQPMSTDGNGTLMERLAARLTGSHGVAAFNADVREQRAVRFEGALSAEEAAGLFDFARLESVLSGPGAPTAQTDVFSFAHLVRLADILHRSGKTPVEVAALQLRKGCTLRFRDVDQFDEQLGDFARAVARVFAAETQINVYLTPPNQDGFPPHFDSTDVFIVQVAGAKDWLIHDHYTNAQTLPGPDVAWDPERYRPLGSPDVYSMRVGDVLYAPRGMMHSAKCRDEESMHLTVSLAPVTLLGLLELELRRMAAEDVALRRRAPWTMTGGAQEAQAVSRELQRLVSQLAERLDASAAIEEQRALLGRRCQPGTTTLRAAVTTLKGG